MTQTTRVSGQRIREARLRAGMTQAQLARAVTTSERNIVRWENDQNAPRLKHLASIARAVGSDVPSLLDTDGAEDEEDDSVRLRRIRAELVLAGRDDLADDLRKLAGGVA